MADWNIPVNTSTYSQVLGMLKAVSVDAGTLFLANPTNQPTGSMRWNRSANQFEEWSGSAWLPKVLSVAGGGTGGSTPTAARTGLGLGTISTQNANAVAITGGNLDNVTLSGNVTFNGGAFNVNSNTTQALNVNGFASFWAAVIVGGAAPSYGQLILAGTGNATERAFRVANKANSLVAFEINGAMTVLIPNRLVIPVGIDAWA